MKTYIILIFIFIYSILSTSYTSYYIYDAISILDYLYNQKSDAMDLIRIRDYISHSIRDIYAFYEINQNPPQPDFDKNYFKKVDISKLLREINTMDISFYELYQKIINKISELKDYAISIKHSKNRRNKNLKFIGSLYSINPIKFNIKKINNNYEIFCKLNDNLNPFFKYYTKDILDIIEENKEQPLLSINNQDPFDFIPNFCDNCRTTKNVHGTFSNKFNQHSLYNLLAYPLDYKDLNMNITYKNGKKFSIKTLIISEEELPEIKNLSIDKLEFEEKIISYKNEKIQWNYHYLNMLKCKADNKSEVNVLYINSFDPYIRMEYEHYFKACINLFDQNNYPIILILEKNINNRPYEDFPQVLIELISPLTSISYYVTQKVPRYNYPENPLCKLDKEFNEQKKALKNKRKPTDILVFTDGALFSESAIFMKYFQFYGSGIVAGYFGNPKYYNIIPFDSSQSPSNILIDYYLNEKSPHGHKFLEERYNISLNIPGYHYYFDDFNYTSPIEFSVTPVDEISDIFEYFTPYNYKLFIDKGKAILNKYKKYCNPKNKKLVFVTSECDKKFENSHTHGGYECGDDGKWSNKCIPSYCDEDFIFNHHLKKCISKEDKDSIAISKINNQLNYSFNIKLILEIISIFIVVFIIYIFIKEKKEKNRKTFSTDREEELLDIQ